MTKKMQCHLFAVRRSSFGFDSDFWFRHSGFLPLIDSSVQFRYSSLPLRPLLDPFLSPVGKPNWFIIALFVGINAIVTFNCFQHEYTIGYDAEDHLEYVRV